MVPLTIVRRLVDGHFSFLDLIKKKGDEVVLVFRDPQRTVDLRSQDKASPGVKSQNKTQPFGDILGTQYVSEVVYRILGKLCHTH